MKLGNIAFSARSESIHFMLAVARRLKAEHGATLHLYCYGAQEVDTYKNLNQDGVFATITDANILYSRCFDSDLDERSVLETARRYEEQTGTTINQLMVPDRHFGRGYALGGYFHPRSRTSEKTSYLQMVHACCEALAFWEKEFRDKDISLCVNGPREAANMARVAGIPYRVLAASRYRNYHYWAHNEFYENPAFEKRWRENAETGDVDMDTPYYTHLASRKSYMKRFSAAVMARGIFRTSLQYAYWNLRGYEKAKGYYFTETVGLYWRIWREYRKLRKLSRTKLADLDGKRFVYFPLHVEPETALHGLSPEYFFQQALIAAVSRDLPAGVLLAVKEAYGCIGRRPPHFYRQISDLKNVVLLDCWEPGIECARTADTVVTICGTAGLEAAVAGTPVIAFGRHNVYNMLSDVRVVTDEALLKDHINDALNDTSIPARIRDESRRLLQSIIDCSFDMGSYDYLDLHKFENEAVEAACKALADSLHDSGVAERKRKSA